MPRPLRIIYQNACYHVMNRGAGKRAIFHNNLHRQIFIDLLRECCQLYNIRIYAYCLMGNHYHLLLSTPDANLSKVMRHLNGVYTQKFNRLTKSDGSLFRGRYHAKLVDEDCYRLLLTRYIHLNPVTAKIVNHPRDYKWSSYNAYLGRSKESSWLSIQDILDQLNQTVSLSHIKTYQDYVEENTFDEINNFISTKFVKPIIGSKIFKEKTLMKIESNYIDACSTDFNRAKATPTLELIAENVCSFYQVDIESLMNIKSGKQNFPKFVFVYLSHKKFSHTLCDIAKFTRYKRYESVSATARKCYSRLKKFKKIAKEVDLIISNIKTNQL